MANLAGGLIIRNEYSDGLYNNYSGSYLLRITDSSVYFKGRLPIYETLGGNKITYYQKKAIDLGSSVTTTWITTDRNSDPPILPPVGPWIGVVVFARWVQHNGIKV